MKWIHNFQLFLFDLDGLLVDSEVLYYQAYLLVMREYGIELLWDFNTYCNKAHVKSKGLRDHTYAEFPSLYAQEPSWDVIEGKIKQHYLKSVAEKQLKILPGVTELLTQLHRFGIKRAVVTNTKREIVEHLKEDLPILKTIPHWFTRESYQFAKPHPDSYLTAIQTLAAPGDRIIGFEDSPRGMQALQQTPALPVMICAHERRVDAVTHYFASFAAIPADWA